MEPVIIVLGPTASGKTGCAVRLARRIGAECVSADSVQIYRGLDIGSAKPTDEDARGVPHHMIDVADPDERFSVARYQEMAKACIDDILSRGVRAIVVGGAGLYIRALTDNLRYPAAPSDPEARARLESVAEELGREAMHARLRAADPEAAARIHPNDAKRVIRALEALQCGGETMTSQIARSRDVSPQYEFEAIGLAVGREELAARIARRVDGMLERGLVEETRGLLARYGAECPALASIGYKEISMHVQGLLSLKDAAELIKTRTRRYAKRQMTWFRAVRGVRWLAPDDAFW